MPPARPWNLRRAQNHYGLVNAAQTDEKTTAFPPSLRRRPESRGTGVASGSRPERWNGIHFRTNHPCRLPPTTTIMKMGPGGGAQVRRSLALRARVGIYVTPSNSRGPAPMDSGSSPERRAWACQKKPSIPSHTLSIPTTIVKRPVSIHDQPTNAVHSHGNTVKTRRRPLADHQVQRVCQNNRRYPTKHCQNPKTVVSRPPRTKGLPKNEISEFG